MNCLLIALCTILLCTYTNAQSNQPTKEPIAILSQSNEHTVGGGYKWSYETANGIKAEETGTLKKTTDKDNPEVIVAQGSYSYTDPDGKLISVTYVADDEGGFRPVGDHLPTPPPIPEAIKKALEFIASQSSTQSPAGK